MSGFSAIDLTKLAAPNVVETLNVEEIVSAMIDDLQRRDPSFSAVVESDPVIKVLEVAAYRELLLRARINDASRAVMLAYAQRTDLDHLAAYFGVERQQITPEDNTTIPPTSARYENDDRLRKRTQLSLEGHSTAGPIGSYLFHALAATPSVKDVDVVSPKPGDVLVTILSFDDRGLATDEDISLVMTRLNAKEVRPLTDRVTVQKATIVEYTLEASLILYEGPDAQVVYQTALDTVTAYIQQHHLLGNDITQSGLYAALHQEGVQRVILLAPTSDVVMASHQAAWCTDIQISIGGRDE